MWVVGLVDSRQVTTAGGRPPGGPDMPVVTHITGRHASRSSSAGVAAISSYLMVSDNVKPSKTGAKAIRRWGGCGAEGRGGWKGGWMEGCIHNKICT